MHSPHQREHEKTTRRRFLGAVAGSSVAGTALANVGTTAGRSGPIETPATAAQDTTDPSFAAADDFESFVDGVMHERIGETTPGMTVAIVEDGELVLAKGYGYADVETELAVQPEETTFPVGSVSKAVTFTGVMQAVEEGVLDLDEDIMTYLDDSPVDVPDTYDDPVTLEHLGTHTAGFESLVPQFLDDPADLTSIETLLVDRQPDRVRPPGETVEYSNYGATLAGHVLAEARGSTFEAVMQSEMFEPLGMEHSTFAQPVPDDHPGRLAKPYNVAGGSFVRADEGYVNARPAGAMTATATDMAAFMDAHLTTAPPSENIDDGPRLLHPETVERMHSRHHVRHPAVNNWRYGVYEAGPVDAGLITHSGGTPNSVSELVLVPEQDLGFFIGYNAAPTENVLLEDILRILREYDLLPDGPTPTRTSGRGAVERAKTVAGEYRPTFLYDNGPARVLQRLGHLAVTSAGGGRLTTSSLSERFGNGLEWVEVAPYVYHEVGGRDVLAFDVTDGDVEQMYLSSIAVGAYEPVGLADRRLVSAGIVGGSAAGFGFSLLGRGAHSGWNRLTSHFDSTPTHDTHETPPGKDESTAEGVDE